MQVSPDPTVGGYYYKYGSYTIMQAAALLHDGGLGHWFRHRHIAGLEHVSDRRSRQLCLSPLDSERQPRSRRSLVLNEMSFHPPKCYSSRSA